jgi:hypothetical protein
MNYPSIEITKQQGLGIEDFSRNDVRKDIYVVAKGYPFNVELAATNLNLNATRIKAELLYDNDLGTSFKTVDFVRTEPMRYRTILIHLGPPISHLK